MIEKVHYDKTGIMAHVDENYTHQEVEYGYADWAIWRVFINNPRYTNTREHIETALKKAIQRTGKEMPTLEEVCKKIESSNLAADFMFVDQDHIDHLKKQKNLRVLPLIKYLCELPKSNFALRSIRVENKPQAVIETINL